MPRSREKRQSRRIQPFVAPCRVVHRTRRILGHLIDLSPRGARVATEEALPRAGSKIIVEARLDPGATTYTPLPGEIKWVRAAKRPLTGHVCGVTFKGISGSQQLALEFVLYEFRRRAAQLS